LRLAVASGLPGRVRPGGLSFETERYDPSLPLAFTIADVFDLTIEEIFLPDRADTTNDPPRP
jgi:putative transcriptional regulator